MTLASLAGVAENAHMEDHEFEVLCARLRETTRYSPPPDEEAHRWVRVLDSAGDPDRWFDADLASRPPALLPRPPTPLARAEKAWRE